MSKKQCKTCQHWTRHSDNWEIASYGEHSGSCDSDRFQYEQGKTPKDGMKYWDSEGYSAGFNTGENFGCIHWMKKTGQEP